MAEVDQLSAADQQSMYLSLWERADRHYGANVRGVSITRLNVAVFAAVVYVAAAFAVNMMMSEGELLNSVVVAVCVALLGALFVFGVAMLLTATVQRFIVNGASNDLHYVVRRYVHLRAPEFSQDWRVYLSDPGSASWRGRVESNRHVVYRRRDDTFIIFSRPGADGQHEAVAMTQDSGDAWRTIHEFDGEQSMGGSHES